MDKHDEQFHSELVEEQIKLQRQSAQQSTGSATPNERMIQDLQYIYTNYTQSGQRVWARLSEHLAQQDIEQQDIEQQDIALQNDLHVSDDAHNTELHRERSGSHLMLPVKESNDLHTQKTTSPRKSKKIITLVTSLLVAAVLIASAFMVIRTTHQPDITTRVANSTTATAPVATSTPSPQQTIPSIDCLQFGGNIAWNNLCKANKVIAVNHSVKLSDGLTATVLGAYADHNQIIILMEATPSIAGGSQLPASMVSTYEQMTTTQGISLQQSAIGTQYLNSGKHIDWIEGFYTNTLPANLAKLDLKLKTTIGINSTPGIHKAATGEITFSVPMNHASIIQPHQTVTTNGVAITLDSVSTGASGTHIVLSAPVLPYYRAFSCVLQNGQQHFQGCNYSIINQSGKSSAVAGFGFTLNYDLTPYHGAWTLTVASASTGQTWVYHFTI